MEHREYIKDVDNGNSVILFIHGILGTPKYFKDFIKVIPKNFAIHNICLDGHGGKVEDFSNTSMEIWKNDIEIKILKLSKKYKNIIIVAHSMGTFFAMQASIKYPKYIKALFLLATPVKIALKPDAGINALKVIFNKVDEENLVTVSAREAYGVDYSLKFWEYTGWLPRYLELFKESRYSRTIIDRICVKTYVFLSLQDEMVSVKSYKYFTKNPNITLKILRNSRHYYYEKTEKQYLLNTLKKICQEID